MAVRGPENQEDLDHNNWLVEFGRRIEILRKHAKVTQGQLAELVGAGTANVLTGLERGEAKGITLRHLSGLITWAHRSGSSAQWLLTGINPAEMASRAELLEQLANDMIAEKFRAGGLKIIDAGRPPGSGPTAADVKVWRALGMIPKARPKGKDDG